MLGHVTPLHKGFQASHSTQSKTQSPQDGLQSPSV